MRLYPNKYVYTTKEQEILLMKDMLLLIQLSYGVESQAYVTMHKKFCNYVRSEIGINNMISFSQSSINENLLVVLVYDIEATEDNHYPTCIDEEGKIYMEIGDK